MRLIVLQAIAHVTTRLRREVQPSPTELDLTVLLGTLGGLDRVGPSHLEHERRARTFQEPAVELASGSKTSFAPCCTRPYRPLFTRDEVTA